MLTPEQKDFFHREGYLVVPEVFSDEVLASVQSDITAEIDKHARVMVEAGELSQTYEEAPFETRLALISQETKKVAHAIWSGVLATPGIFGLLTDERLLSVAESLCGPEIIASSVYRLRPKVPNYNYGAVPWHQDSGYFEEYCDKALVLTVWVPLVDATEENGCLWVLPGQHKSGELLTHQVSAAGTYLQIDTENIPHIERSVPVPIKRGSVLLMTNRTPHVSYENKTDIVRWSMDLRYQSAALPTNAPITRLPGEAVSAPGSSIPIACYPPEADFLVRSSSRPNEVLRDAAAFVALRENHQEIPSTNRWNGAWKAVDANS